MANNLSFEFVFAEKDSNGEWKLLEATQRYPSERGLDLLEPLWQRLKGDQTIDANLQRIEVSYKQ
jgi:inner membrane protein